MSPIILLYGYKGKLYIGGWFVEGLDLNILGRPYQLVTVTSRLNRSESQERNILKAVCSELIYFRR